MGCNCNTPVIQGGSQFCGMCMPDETNWLIPMDGEPDPFLMDRHHAYITPDGTVYVLNHAGTRAINMGSAKFDATEINNTLNEYRNRIAELEARPDRDTDTIYDDTELRNKLNKAQNDLANAQADIARLLQKQDNDTIYDDTELKRKVNELNTALENANRIIGELERRQDNDTVYNDAEVRSLITGLTGEVNKLKVKPDKDTVYDDTEVKRDIDELKDELRTTKEALSAERNKEDKDKQTLSIQDRTISISNGNSITLPEDRDTVYDDRAIRGDITNLTNRVGTLEGKADNDKQTLSVEGNRLSISNGNSVDLPQYDDTRLVNLIRENERQAQVNVDNLRDGLNGRIGNIHADVDELKKKQDQDNQTLSVQGRTLTISGGNSITLPEGYDDTALRKIIEGLTAKVDDIDLCKHKIDFRYSHNGKYADSISTEPIKKAFKFHKFEVVGGNIEEENIGDGEEQQFISFSRYTTDGEEPYIVLEFTGQPYEHLFYQAKLGGGSSDEDFEGFEISVSSTKPDTTPYPRGKGKYSFERLEAGNEQYALIEVPIGADGKGYVILHMDNEHSASVLTFSTDVNDGETTELGLPPKPRHYIGVQVVGKGCEPTEDGYTWLKLPLYMAGRNMAIDTNTGRMDATRHHSFDRQEGLPELTEEELTKLKTRGEKFTIVLRRNERIGGEFSGVEHGDTIDYYFKDSTGKKFISHGRVIANEMRSEGDAIDANPNIDFIVENFVELPSGGGGTSVDTNTKYSLTRGNTRVYPYTYSDNKVESSSGVSYGVELSPSVRKNSTSSFVHSYEAVADTTTLARSYNFSLIIDKLVTSYEKVGSFTKSNDMSSYRLMFPSVPLAFMSYGNAELRYTVGSGDNAPMASLRGSSYHLIQDGKLKMYFNLYFAFPYHNPLTGMKEEYIVDIPRDVLDNKEELVVHIKLDGVTKYIFKAQFPEKVIASVYSYTDTYTLKETN